MSFQPRIYGVLSLGIPSTQSKHMCPFYSRDLLFCLGYANEQIEALFSSFHSLFGDLVSVFHPVCLSPFICLRARNDPCSVSGLSFLVSLFLLFSVSICTLCPNALCFLLTVDIDHSDLSDWLPSKSVIKERKRWMAERR